MKRQMSVIGVPFALGGSESGPAKGPRALIAGGLLSDLNNLGYEATYVDTKAMSANPAIFAHREEGGRMHSANAVREVTRIAGAHTFMAHRTLRFPLILGGDHSVSIGTLPQFLDPAITSSKKVGLLWIDAHYDAHTRRTSHSHYANGLPLASVLGRGDSTLFAYRMRVGKATPKRLSFSPRYVLHVGAGDSDCEPEESALLANLRVRTVTMRDIRNGGVDAFARPLEQLLKCVDHLIVTIDLDAIHQDYAPGVSFRSQHGMIPPEAFLIGDMIAKSGKLRQLEIMEYNPDFEVYLADQPLTQMFVTDFLSHILAQ